MLATINAARHAQSASQLEFACVPRHHRVPVRSPAMNPPSKSPKLKAQWPLSRCSNELVVVLGGRIYRELSRHGTDHRVRYTHRPVDFFSGAA
jgi:hypothetical protein